MATCLELASMAAICEENQIAKDFYLSAYGDSAPIDTRIKGALNNIMLFYQVPEEIRRKKI